MIEQTILAVSEELQPYSLSIYFADGPMSSCAVLCLALSGSVRLGPALSGCVRLPALSGSVLFCPAVSGSVCLCPALSGSVGSVWFCPPLSGSRWHCPTIWNGNEYKKSKDAVSYRKIILVYFIAQSRIQSKFMCFHAAYDSPFTASRHR